MTYRVVIIGAGMGGLTAAIRLARKGLSVRVIEARAGAGGLASGFEKDGLKFDAGPYVLLDCPGLEWAFRAVGLELTDHVSLRRIDEVYEVLSSEGVTVRFYGDLKKTASGFDALWPGSGKLYEDFVASTGKTHKLLSPLLHVSRPGASQLLTGGRFTRIPFLLQSLKSILKRTNLPLPVVEAIAIWTQIAGQRMDDAPSPLAFVPALIHSVGALYPVDGIATIPRVLELVAREAGVEFLYHTRVRRIVCESGRISGVEANEGEFLGADAIVSNYSGIGTYLEMLEATPAGARKKLNRLPLQSPGACAYLAIKGEAKPPYLRFKTFATGELCRLLVTPGVVAPELNKNGWFPARLISPMRHEEAERLGVEGQREYLAQLIKESWWRDGVDDYRVVDTRVPAEWGSQFNLYRDSMNPVMTAGFMRAGRLAHRSPHARGLYLAGSSTHPGQWVSFCAISGILAADDLLEDIR